MSCKDNINTYAGAWGQENELAASCVRVAVCLASLTVQKLLAAEHNIDHSHTVECYGRRSSSHLLALSV